MLGLHYGAGWDVWFGILSLRCRYEPHVARVISRVFRESGSTFIDVGAFIGFHTLYAYKIIGNRKPSLLVAVEPDPRNYQALIYRLPEAVNIRAVRLAIWISVDDEVEFYVGASRWRGSGSISPTKWHKNNGLLTGESIVVKTVRLDTLVRRMGISVVDLVKMDIEGAEYPVLTDPTLNLSAVRNLVVEVHYKPMSRESIEIHRSLKRKGYNIVALPPELDGRRYHIIATRDGKIPW
ncbi:MAG: FkbM family methyltransferase [Thermosphaera sp.]